MTFETLKQVAGPGANIFLHRSARFLCSVLVTMSLLHGAAAQAAQTRPLGFMETIIVPNDRGGSVRQRHDEIRMINRLHQQVEIRGRECLSSCTMYLGADNVCVEPNTSFGFHGPHRFLKTLTKTEFDQWSRFISGYYPPPVQTWYMQKARYKTATVSRIKGRELIRLGVTQCD